MRKKLFILSIVFTMIFSNFSLIKAEEPARQINLVYDDSGSMIYENGKYLDRWCQAKYAMEVFAAMLGEKDSLNIYYMSDSSKGKPAKSPTLKLKGSSGAESNVKKIHNTVTTNSKTPFESVKAACNGFSKDKTEKWLVVLTDGAFDGTNSDTVEKYYKEVSKKGIKVIMLSMDGPASADITPDPDNNIFFYRAESSEDILSKLTDVCYKIFQLSKLTVSNNKINFDIPMNQLIVFAQGNNADVKEIKSKKSTFSPNSTVNVKYSEEATSGKGKTYGDSSKWIVARNLNGCVATFNTRFEKGSYTLDATGENIEVYYKPDVSIKAFLYDEKGKEFNGDSEKIVSGKYKLQFKFVDSQTGKKIKNMNLLGGNDIEYTATIKNRDVKKNGETKFISNGEEVNIKQGYLDIDVTAKYLKLNEKSDHITYKIFSNNKLVFSFKDKVTYELTPKGFKNGDKPSILKVMLKSPDGDKRSLEPDELVALGLPKVTTSADLGKFKVENGDNPGEYKIYPTLYKDNAYSTDGGTIDLTVSGSFKYNDSSAQGKNQLKMEIDDSSIGWWMRILQWILDNLWRILLGILIILYIIKPRIPRAIKSKPYVRKVTNRKKNRGQKPVEFQLSGKKSVFWSSRLMPYVAQRGSIRIGDSGVTFNVKAKRGGRLIIENQQRLASREGMKIFVDNIPLSKCKNGLKRSSHIHVETEDFIYDSWLNKVKPSKRNKKGRKRRK